MVIYELAGVFNRLRTPSIFQNKYSGLLTHTVVAPD